MSRIRGYDTKPEKVVRSLLHRAGYRFRLRDRKLLGHPDIVLPKYNTVIFVHGCFWHRHQRCKFAYMPKSRSDFWQRKFSENVDRDRRTELLLQGSGWNVIVVWECETENLAILIQRLQIKMGTNIKNCAGRAVDCR
jgi:DNA mismatch endonuclease (patch repair protein)